MKLSPSEELILRAIAHREMYGAEIAKALLECCDRNIREGTLYPSLRRLRKEKLVSRLTEVTNGTVRDYYKLTELGIDTLIAINEGFEKLNNWEKENAGRKNNIQ
jgi:DNA-binding PadR family transcriptional regulator